MALTLLNTLSDPLANSYADVDYADAYWAVHYSTTKASQWGALEAGSKVMALLHACRVLETVRFTVFREPRAASHKRYDRHSRKVITFDDQQVPTKWLWTQRLQFPRNLDLDYTTGVTYIPEPILMAQCEQALYLLNFDETAIANRLQGITTDTTVVGNIHLRQTLVQDGSQFSPTALEMCRPYLLKSSARVERA